ncbi:MAG: 2-dehydropantoate 2-reductase [Proteobacteria bacterium]|jgi:2-dehydropantoate 2-reductase|nr:2-dehydropantoate 2-reductase [Pseudomonadota bacterium]
MKIAIIGAGAIGGYVGAKLALAGEDVTFIVRGANLEAIRANGVRLLPSDGGEPLVARARATDDYAAAGAQDMVILAMKAHQVEAVAPQVPRLFGPDTFVVTMQNGIPYWYFHRHGGELAGSPVRSVDPEGIVGRHIPAERVLGCVVYPASELVAPGVIRHIEGTRFPVGELDGATSERAKRTSECFTKAGFKSPILEDIRSEIWLKLWGNLTFNPISALTRSTLVDICQYGPTRALAASMMSEAQAVAEKLGIRFRVGLDQRIAGAEKVGKHKTSMLQDVEAGRPPEIAALVGSVVELGRLTGTPTPHIEAVHALVNLLARECTVCGATLAQPAAPAAIARLTGQTRAPSAVLHA